MFTRRENQAFQLAPAAAPYVVLVAEVVSRASIMLGEASVSRVLLITGASYGAALLVARPVYARARARVRSTSMVCILAGGLSGVLAGAVFAVVLYLNEYVWRAPGVLSDIPAIAFFGAIVGAVMSLPSVFTLWALVRRNSSSGTGPNPSLNRTPTGGHSARRRSPVSLFR